ncbi:MAG: hypothetical protein IKF91_02050 [Bacilli bacterium]|nr:hypothetical protein [Bacilli bacterium]
MIKEISACFIENNNLYCLKGADGGQSYEENISILQSAFPEQGVCKAYEDYEFTCHDNESDAYTNPDLFSNGGIIVRYSEGFCQLDIDENDDAYCDLY